MSVSNCGKVFRKIPPCPSVTHNAPKYTKYLLGTLGHRWGGECGEAMDWQAGFGTRRGEFRNGGRGQDKGGALHL
jgi:hypothetical protein